MSYHAFRSMGPRHEGVTYVGFFLGTSDAAAQVKRAAARMQAAMFLTRKK